MKRAVIFFFLSLLPIVAAAQNVYKPKAVFQYVFQEFHLAKILYKSGYVKEVPLNYNTLTEEMIFSQDDRLLAIDNASMMDTIYIAGRKFIPRENSFHEVLKAGGVTLYIQHKNNLLPPPKAAGYGSTSETSATDSYSSVLMEGMNYYMEIPTNYRLIPRTEFYVKKANTLYQVNSSGQLISAYPEKKKMIKQKAKEQKTNFNQPEDVLRLLYALQQ